MKKAPLTADPAPPCKRLFDFGDIVKIRTVSQFRLIWASWGSSFSLIFGSLLNSTCHPRVSQGITKGTQKTPQGIPGGDFEGKGEYLDWFPPYMGKAPPSAASGSRCKRFFHFGDIIKIRTVSWFRLILAFWKIIAEALFGYVFHMHHQRVPKAAPRRPWR